MIFDIITIFPAFFDGFLKYGVVAKALNNGTKHSPLKINIINLRDFGIGRHKITDDRPFGGGAGMVMCAEPIYQAIKSILPDRFHTKNRRATPKSDGDCRVILLSPQGRKFSQKEAERLSKLKRIVLICGRYEGVDERIMEFVDEEISIGDYVISGGEAAAMVVVDAVARLLPEAGVVKERASVENDSFVNGILDYPHYTRPAVWRGRKIPAVLLSGHHKKIMEWRRNQALSNTKKKRPDLLKTSERPQKNKE